jgi:hypothetical protein
MDSIAKLTKRRAEIVRQIAALPPMRRGTVNEQYLETVRKDGSRTKRGPYCVYTFKEKKKTLSRRLRDKAQAQLYREQIDAFRRFQSLVAELVEVGQALADRTVAEAQQEKKRLRR